MKEIILKFFYILGLLTVCTSVFAEELYKCVTSQGTTYQSRPCSAKATQKTPRATQIQFGPDFLLGSEEEFSRTRAA